MSNLLQYANKTTVIDQMTTSIIEDLFYQYKTGDIRTETELFYRIKLELERFYQNLHKPSFEFRAAVSTPVSSDYNQMIEEAIRDVRCLITDCQSLGDSLNNSFVEAEVSRQLFTSELKYISQKLKDMNERLVQNTDGTFFVHTESFNNLEQTENFVSSSSAYVNRNDNVLTLKPLNQTNFESDVEIEILPTSNGTPGNTHLADMISGKVTFDGSKDAHLNLNEILDGNQDTWFEYETFQVSDETIEACGNYGFHYQEGLPWMTEEDVLKLHLKLHLNTRPTCNWISLDPFVAEVKGVKPAQLVRCLISDGGSQIQIIEKPQMFDDNLVLIFNPQPVAYIKLEFEQEKAYQVQVGHQAYLKTSKASLGYYDNSNPQETYRVEGPMPTVQAIGVQYDPKTRQFTPPLSSHENVYLSQEERLKQELFEAKADLKDVKSQLELIPAKRFSIGIRKISIAHYRFSETGEHISTPYESTKPIKTVTLEAEESVPESFKAYLEAGENPYKWIQYAISTDNGATWHDIYPKHRAYDGPCRFEINHGDIRRYLGQGEIKERVGMITSFTTVNHVKLRITLSKPAEDDFQTPIVYQYKLKMTTGEDNFAN